METLAALVTTVHVRWVWEQIGTATSTRGFLSVKKNARLGVFIGIVYVELAFLCSNEPVEVSSPIIFALFNLF